MLKVLSFLGVNYVQARLEKTFVGSLKEDNLNECSWSYQTKATPVSSVKRARAIMWLDDKQIIQFFMVEAIGAHCEYGCCLYGKNSMSSKEDKKYNKFRSNMFLIKLEPEKIQEYIGEHATPEAY